MFSSKNWMLIIVVGLAFSFAQQVDAQSRTRTVRHRQVANEYVAPPAPKTHVARAYVPQHVRTAGIQTGVTSVMSESLPGETSRITPTMQASHGTIISNEVVGGPVTSCVGCGSTHSMSTGCPSCGGCSTGFGGPVDTTIGTYFEGPIHDECGSCGGYGLDDCCGRGGCPPMAYEDCWLNGLFGIFQNGELFFGGTGFRSEQFQVPGATNILDDASFGFYGGANFGFPLCKLTCGLLSGQIGVRAVSSEFDGNSFFGDNRDQTFFTGGFFRRVDYGLQFGVVADVLREEWFTESETVQLRGDISWVYPGGNALGFRWANQLQDDITDGVASGAAFTGLTTSIIETYRFYYRHVAPWGGYSDFSLGWSDNDHFILGWDFDMPLSETLAMQSSLTYLAGEDLPPTSPFAGNGNEAWNLSVGVAWRPRGRIWYRNYDRPLFGVADNGTMILQRN